MMKFLSASLLSLVVVSYGTACPPAAVGVTSYGAGYGGYQTAPQGFATASFQSFGTVGAVPVPVDPYLNGYAGVGFNRGFAGYGGYGLGFNRLGVGYGGFGFNRGINIGIGGFGRGFGGLGFNRGFNRGIGFGGLGNRGIGGSGRGFRGFR